MVHRLEPKPGSSNWDTRHHGTHTSPRQQVVSSPQSQPSLLPHHPDMSATYPQLMPGPEIRSHPSSIGFHSHAALAHGSAHVYPPPGPGFLPQQMRHPSQYPAIHYGEGMARMPSGAPSMAHYDHALLRPQPHVHGSYAANTYPQANAAVAPRPRLIQSMVPTPSQDPKSDPVVPTYFGLIKDVTDAILLLAACDLPAGGRNPDEEETGSRMQPSPPPRRIRRRLLEHERPSLIATGSVFVWEESDANIRRWTDGKCWSASRVSGQFLTYRELELRKRPARDGQGARANQYKVEGLIKQSYSLETTSGRKFHIVSYYTKRDLREGTLGRVSEDPRFVGEAGGEWGLSIDENEFRDRSTIAQDQASLEIAAASPNIDLRDHTSAGDAASIRTGTAPSSPRDALASSPHLRYPNGGPHSPIAQFGETSQRHSSSHLLMKSGTHASGPSRFSAAERSLMPASATTPILPSSGRDDWDEGRDASLSLNLDARPPLKRKRSSSAGELYRRVSSTTEASMRERLSDDRDAVPSGNLLTESNVRGANLGGPPMSRKLTHPDLLTPSTYTEQDSAAGVLLSLRGSLNGQASTGNPTPLTTPDDADQIDGIPLTKQPSGQGSSAEGTATLTSGERPKAPERLRSDRDVLSKLSVRL